MRFQSYFNSAIRIIQSYDGSIPLHHFLKQYFSQHKKHGSKDRKIIAHVCYNFYRLGKAFSTLNIEKKLKLAIYLCNDEITEWKFLYDEDWQINHSNILSARIAFIQTKYSFYLEDVFPFVNELSEGLNADAFIQSFFIQPEVFIRVRPTYKENVLDKLKEHQIPFAVLDEDAIALPASISINSIIKIDEEAVIQDYSSQQIKKFLLPVKNHTSNIIHQTNIWDCCAGSGGKSILAYDVLENIKLTVSDVRASIIQNLKARFEKAGVKNYKLYVADITNSQFQVSNSEYDLIICDAPCTGSGTWSRTPEQLYFFKPEKIDEYVSLQKKIISNAIKAVKDNSWFLYITCSVFQKENEDITDFIKQQFHLDLIKMELLKGYNMKSDTMFAALFKKSLSTDSLTV